MDGVSQVGPPRHLVTPVKIETITSTTAIILWATVLLHVQCWRLAAGRVVIRLRRPPTETADCYRVSCRQRPAVDHRARRGWSTSDQDSASTSVSLTLLHRRASTGSTPVWPLHAVTARSCLFFFSTSRNQWC